MSGSDVRRSFREFIRSGNQTHAATFNFGYRVTAAHAHKCMAQYCKRIERAALGRKWYRKSNPRLICIGFPEHLTSNPHWHAVMVAPEPLAATILARSKAIWSKLVPRGQIVVGQVESAEKVAAYFTKEAWKRQSQEEVFVYTADVKVETGKLIS